MESGDFPQTKNGKDNETSNTEIQVQTEYIGNENGWLPSECGDYLQRNPIENLNQDVRNHSANQEGPRIRANCPTPSQFGQPNSLGQASSMSAGTTRQDQNFMNNMNKNLQNVLSPLILMLQKSQDHVEERDQMQRSRDDERQMLMCEKEEEQRPCKTQIRTEKKRRNDQMNIYMMAMISKMTGVPLDDPPADLRMGE
ncbi:hypothetical protein O181_125946 [Austropuccinia psidii MF-1]|uniref:Uncharacterized protein n=1 Tax=Austropuccinia psidii MF-1 TaxID=1389203 RepID=A0A9Q3KTD7_9BASI|nr:hypothetical protein [Austropuccinia psidii MF-1]